MTPLRFGSVCSGIEAISVGWRGLPFESQWFAEIAPFPSAVLAARWSNVPNVGDFTRIDHGAGSIDLLGGGTPCQDFSVAGLRAGLAGERGNLTLEFVRLAGRARPRWVLWENVPGVLSIDGGRAFGAFLGGLGQLGYGVAYRVLDAQFFGVPQRRRRVFVVGYLGDWRRAAAVLFERDCLSWNPPPSRKAGTGVAAAIGAQSAGGRGWRLGADEAAGGQVVSALSESGIGVSGPDDNQGQAGHLIADTAPPLDASYGRLYGHDNQRIDAGGGLFVSHGPDVSPALKARDRKGPSSDGDGDGDGAPLIAHTLRGQGFDASEDGTGRGTPMVAVDLQNTRMGGDVAGTLDTTRPTRGGGQAVMATAYRTASGAGNTYETGDRTDALTTNTDPNSTVLRSSHGVRRLTPRECERLQGFPDDYTLIPTKAAKKLEPEMMAYYRAAFPGATEDELRRLAKDGPRYEALGNSMATPVMRWLGERILMVEGIDGT